MGTPGRVTRGAPRRTSCLALRRFDQPSFEAHVNDFATDHAVEGMRMLIVVVGHEVVVSLFICGRWRGQGPVGPAARIGTWLILPLVATRQVKHTYV